MPKSKRATRSNRNESDVGRSQQASASEVYQELISEAIASSAVTEDSRPLKRRKTATQQLLEANDQSFGSERHSRAEHDDTGSVARQVIFDDSQSSNGGDFDWQEVDLEEDLIEAIPVEEDTVVDDVEILFGHRDENKAKVTSSKRKPITAAEKKLRLEIHKLHILCHIAHVHTRNIWCNSEDIQMSLRPRLNRRTVSYLTPDENMSQFQRSRSFMDGLQQAMDIWQVSFKVTAHGLRRPLWVSEPSEQRNLAASEDSEPPVDKSEFLRMSKILEGSRDTGAQLFCALLRSVGVDARIVCSLQVLSFNSGVQPPRPQSAKTTIYHPLSDSEIQEDALSGSTDIDGLPTSITNNDSVNVSHPQRVKRFGQSLLSPGNGIDLGKPPPYPKQRKAISDSPYPIYWIEAFNSALQKWIPVDAMTTKSISKSTKFEPPQSPLYDMSYVIAFEDDYTVKDVTRRYARAFNAKTRQNRIDSTKSGASWWKQTLKTFDNGFIADREQVEAAELAQKEASEPMPRNAQDFKNHPHYALERHLRHDEIIYPKREVGKFTAGKHSAIGVESIYRRSDVQIVKNADKWFRLGREVKAGEQPLKYGKKRHGNLRLADESDAENVEDDGGIGLYADFQTELYIPPPVVKGRVPKNAFGNLDIYVASMIPSGGVHIRIPEAAKAARLVGIDYADAVTGFEFKGRRGTAITQGVVVAAQHLEAVVAVIENIWEVQDEAAAQKKNREALRYWKRFMTGLRIRARVIGDASDVEVGDVKNQLDDHDANDDDHETFQEGGFMPEIMEDTEQNIARGSREHDQGSYDANTDVDMSSPNARQLQAGTVRRVPSAAIIHPPMLNSQISMESKQAEAVLAPNIAGNTSDVEMDEGGGFLHEDSPVPEPSHCGPNSQKPSTADPIPESHQFVEHLAAEDVITNKASDFAASDRPLQDSAPESQIQAMDIDGSGSALLSNQVDISSEAEVRGSASEVAVDETAAAEEESDAASLLSHDPEDDDAEPEWLFDEAEL